MSNPEVKPQISFEEAHRGDDRIVGAGLLAAGASLAGIGYIGIDSVEAKTPHDAIASVDLTSVNIESQYITTGDLPFAGALVVGGICIAAGARKLFRRS